MAEAPEHHHNKLRRTFVDIDGVVQPAPAPRFGRTKPTLPRPPEAPGASAREALLEWGFSEADIAGFVATKAITPPPPRHVTRDTR
jgi:alpha-methylacyl-CoA racemase